MALCEKSGFSKCLSFCNIPTGTRIALRLTTFYYLYGDNHVFLIFTLQKSKDTYEEKIRDQQQYIADLRSGEL